MAGRTKIVKTLGWQGQPQERNKGCVRGKLAAVVVPGDEKTREQETMAGGHGSDHTQRLTSAKPSSQDGNASDPQIALANPHEAGSIQSAITENCQRQDEQTAGRVLDAPPTRLNSGQANVLISPASGTEVEKRQPALKKRKSDVMPRINAKGEENNAGLMKRRRQVTEGAKAGSNVDDSDDGTKGSGARDQDALKQVQTCDQNTLTKLLTNYGLATDGSHQERVHRFYDGWRKTKSDGTKTAPEVQTDGSDNDHKADSAHPSFLDALPSLQLSTLLLSLGKPGNGNRRVLEDSLIECYKQEHGLTSDLDHSTSDEEALDASEEGGTSTRTSAAASNILEALPPLTSGQGRSASTMVFLSPPCCFVRCNCAAL
jgi:hypothetical protein